jgi:FG-GAP-like repeat
MVTQSIRRIPAVALSALLLLTVAAKPSEASTDTIPLALNRIGALANANLDIDGKDDERVDAGIAIFDTGVALDNPNVNLISAVDCMNATAENEYACDESPGAGDDTHGHGTAAAIRAAGIDYGSDAAGVAPGARIYAVRDVDEPISQAEKDAAKEAYDKCLEGGGKEIECAAEVSIPWSLAPAIGATKWVTAHADEIDVAATGPGRLCAIEPVPDHLLLCTDEQQIAEYREAVAEMVDAGVVYVEAALPYERDVSSSAGGSMPADAIITSVVADGDGLPGGKYEGDPCPFDQHPSDKDDTRWDRSGWGENVAIAAPACAPSSAIPQVAGAGALLASIDHPESREDVEAIRGTLIESGDTGEIAEGGWHDDSGDGFKEPLVDVGDEELFAPETTPGCAAVAGDAESDVDGDGRSDLVTLRPDGRVYVHKGNSEAKFGSAIASFDDEYEDGPLLSALYIGEGHHVVDVADVTGDGCDDLVTLASDASAYVYRGMPDATFGLGTLASPVPGNMTPALLKEGGHEPIAAADVNGDGHADLVTYRDAVDDVRVFLGQPSGKFAEPVSGVPATVYAALHTGSGEYFLDLADVTGDGRADLVSMTTWDDLWVRPGNSTGTFDGAVGTTYHSGFTVDPAMEDGAGEEPLGLGDVNGDGKADLMTTTGGYGYVYPGTSGGWFSAKVKQGPGTSTTFNSANAFEVAGILNVDGNAYADLVLRDSSGITVVKGTSNGVFSGAAQSLGGFKSTQHFQNQVSGNEMVIEKPAYRRRGCASNGCHYSTASPSPASGFGATSRGDRYSIFPSEPDGDVLQRWWNAELGWSGWGWHGSPPGGQASSESAAVSPTPSSNYVFVRGANGALWQKSWSDESGKWSEWSSLGGELATGAGPAAASRETGKMDLFARAAADKSVIRKSWTSGSGWGSWETVAGTTGTTGLGVSSRNGGLALFMRDAEGDITQRWWGSKLGWSELGWHGSPPGGPATSAPAAISPSQDSVHVFVRGADRGIWEKVWTDESGKWTSWSPLGGVLRSGPAVASRAASGEIHLFARAANDSYWRKRWSQGGGWSQWEPVY